MICLYSEQHKLHNPPFEVFNGDHEQAQEVPERIENIKSALEKSKFVIQRSNSQVPMELLEQIHDKDYLEYLQDQSEVLNNDQYTYPSVHPYSFYHKHKGSDLGDVARRGLYVFDTYTPILKDTYHAALTSASIAYEAAEKLIHNPKERYYAMCRPPGHHAERAIAGGYCYINNAAVAAQRLSQLGRVAIFDVDFHHGNGTQGIFYERDDVLTVSIHADPKVKFPHFTGFENEKGTGRGRNYNMNIPLPLGTGETEYSSSLQMALDAISRFKAEFIVVAFGADTHVNDPIGGFKLTTGYYRQMAKEIKSLNTPSMIVQEGGYNSSFLGEVIVSFLSGFY